MKAQEIEIQQGSDTWLSLRKEKIGSSDAAVVMGISKWRTPLQLWSEKLDLTPPQQVNDAMRRGTELEPIARDLFCDQLQIKMIPKVFINDFQIASFDGVSNCNRMAVEIKCPNKIDHEMAQQSKVPNHYYPQVQHQMIVLDIKEMYYMSYYKEDNWTIFQVKRDDDYCEKLLDKEREFWQYLHTLESPPLCDRDYTERYDEEWHIKASQWNKANQELKQIEKIQEELRKDLIKLADGKNCKGAGVKISSSVRKGGVDYLNIPLLKEMNLEQYRKPSTTIWRLGEI